MDLADVIPREPGMSLHQGKVAVVGTKFVHIDYAGGRVLNAGRFDGATYVVGDYVWFLMHNDAGALILGKQTPGTHDEATPAPGAAVIVAADAFASYDTGTGTWTASVLQQAPTSVACWFYTPNAFAALVGVGLAAFEVEVTRLSGGPPEFGTHLNSVAAGPLLRGTDSYLKDLPPVGVATWVPLPLDWGLRLVTGSIMGLTVGGGLYSGVYSGTGRTRMSPI